MKQLMSFLKYDGATVPTVLLLIAALAGPAPGATRVKIDSVSPKFLMKSFYFEVNNDSSRARVVVQYINPVAEVWGSNGNVVPPLARLRVPGLEYDSATGAVIYADGAKRTVCATVRERKILLWKSVSLKPTGACTVTSSVTDHSADDGWNVSHPPTTDAFLEIK
jgi:hypothetical protein